MRKAMERRVAISRASILRVLVVALIILLLGVMLLVLDIWEKQKISDYEGPASDDIYGRLEYEGKWYEQRSDVETLLVIGLDTFGETVGLPSYNNNQQADFLILLIFDHTNKTCSAIHLNRDTMADITVLGIGGKKVGTIQAQLALSHTYGSGAEDSCHNTVRAVSKLLCGMRIDNYLSLTMDAVAVLNDALGGVTVTVLDDMTDTDAALVEGATVTLMGDQALSYVRNRYGLPDSSNLRRMERQRQYLTALYERLLNYSKQNGGLKGDVLTELSQYATTDSMTMVEDMFERATSYEMQDIIALPGEAVLGEEHIEYYVDLDEMRKIIVETFYK